jgi:uncharacterized protein
MRDHAMINDDVESPYWRALAAGGLKLPKCAQCGHWHWPAVARCGVCGSWTISWDDVAPNGRIFSWTRTWHPFAQTESFGVPFVSLLVELPEAGDRRLLGLLKGSAEGLRIGATVKGEVGESIVGARHIPVMQWQIID